MGVVQATRIGMAAARAAMAELENGFRRPYVILQRLPHGGGRRLHRNQDPVDIALQQSKVRPGRQIAEWDLGG